MSVAHDCQAKRERESDRAEKRATASVERKATVDYLCVCVSWKERELCAFDNTRVLRMIRGSYDRGSSRRAQ